MNTAPNRTAIAALFQNRSDAEAAIEDLRQEGYSSDQIAVSFTGADAHISDERWQAEGEEHRSFWQKIEDFFSGHERTTENRTSSSPSFGIPNQYRSRIESGEILVVVYDVSRLEDAAEIMRDHNGTIENDFVPEETTNVGSQDFGSQNLGSQNAGSRDVSGEGMQRLQLISEVLRVRKERVQTGEVRVRKEVRTEQKNIQVPVTREELVIDRVEGSGTPTGNIGTDKEIRVPLSEERVQVEKQPVVREEVRVGKRRVEETRNVGDQVRHEELQVENEGDAKVRDPRTGRKKDVA